MRIRTILAAAAVVSVLAAGSASAQMNPNQAGGMSQTDVRMSRHQMMMHKKMMMKRHHMMMMKKKNMM